jgi:hypothetical protein
MFPRRVQHHPGSISTPCDTPTRQRFSEALRELLKKELDSVTEHGIIAKVKQHTDWVNSLICVTKSNGCVWMQLNPFIPTLVDVLWNIKWDQQSSLYTTFDSPYGRYRFLCLPFGLVCAQNIFQGRQNLQWFHWNHW